MSNRVIQARAIEKIFFTRQGIGAIRGANDSPSLESNCMSTGKEQLDVEDDFVMDADDSDPPPVEPAKTNLSKRRTIDNMLEERRLQRELADYDFDI